MNSFTPQYLAQGIIQLKDDALAKQLYLPEQLKEVLPQS